MQIYKVTNIINGKIYIGQTSKNDPNYLGSGPIIMKAIRKYGKESFIKEIIESCDSKEMLNEREIFWISFYNSTDRNTGYNISTGGNGGNLGELVNEKISKASIGRIMAKDKDGNVFVVDKDDERYLSGDLVGILRGVPAHNKGIPMGEEQKEKLRKPKPDTEEYRNKMRKAIERRPKIKILCLNDNKVYTMKEASIEFNLTVPNIISVLKGRKLKTKGYSFRYLDK